MAIFLLSCRQDADMRDFGYEYYPLEPGHWVAYEVDTMFFDVQVDTFHADTFQLKYLVASTFTDNEGRTAYRIEVYRRPDNMAAWKIQSVWMANQSRSQAALVEHNLRYIKLVFPIREGKTWKGNAHITRDAVPFNCFPSLEGWDYEYLDVNEPATYGDINFDSVTTVLQRDFGTLIDTTRYEAHYAKHVGMVYQQRLYMEKDIGNSWDDANCGYRFSMQVIDYGKTDL